MSPDQNGQPNMLQVPNLAAPQRAQISLIHDPGNQEVLTRIHDLGIFQEASRRYYNNEDVAVYADFAEATREVLEDLVLFSETVGAWNTEKAAKRESAE